MTKYNSLKIENQLCFPLYACSKEIIKRYKPFLETIGLTYTQYITMMVLWDKKDLNVKSLGEMLFLDSGTLTPLLKKLENKGYIKRKKSSKDERNLIISITKKGIELQSQAKEIPSKISQCIPIDPEEAMSLYTSLYKILNHFKNN